MIRKTLTAVAALTFASGIAQAQSYSLDDNPTSPYTSPFSPPFSSAEDPFGLGLPPVFIGLIGGSPSLFVGPFVDGDVLYPEPSMGLPALDVVTPTSEYMDALSADHEIVDVERFPRFQLRFSVDRATDGLPGTALNRQFILNQQPGDVFITEDVFRHPGFFAGTLGGGPFSGELPSAVAGGFGTNILDFDESELFLTAGMGPGTFVDPFTSVPPIVPGEWDNVDAFNIVPEPKLDVDGDGVTDFDIFTSVPPASAIFGPVSAADIFATPAGSPFGSISPWAPAPSMGLDTFGFPPNTQFEFLRDDIDALIVWDNGELVIDPTSDPDGNPFGQGQRAEPVKDYALFSLSPGSASLEALRSGAAFPGIPPFPVDASTIFFTDFTGSFAIYAYGSQLGVRDFGVFQNDIEANIDALELCVELEPPACPCRQLLADINMDGSLTGADFNAFLAAFSAGDCRADVNRDGAFTGADFNAFLTAFTNGTPCP